MRALLIGTTLLEELGIEEYKEISIGLLSLLGYEPTLADAEAERSALLLSLIGARILGSERLRPIARQALENDIVVYLSPCVRKAFLEMRFSTPIREATIYELLPDLPISLSGKALLACSRRLVRPEIEKKLRGYGLEVEEDCLTPFLKIVDYQEYVRVRPNLVRLYRGYLLTCPFQTVLFKEENEPYRELLALAYDLLKHDRRD